jgi:hypothetical protein
MSNPTRDELRAISEALDGFLEPVRKHPHLYRPGSMAIMSRHSTRDRFMTLFRAFGTRSNGPWTGGWVSEVCDSLLLLAQGLAEIYERWRMANGNGESNGGVASGLIAEYTLHETEVARLEEILATLTAATKEQTETGAPQVAMDRFFYEEMCKPRHISGTNQDILDRAKKDRHEWSCPGSIQGMRARAETYRARFELPEIPPRKDKRK